jgi:hypothetical protein
LSDSMQVRLRYWQSDLARLGHAGGSSTDAEHPHAPDRLQRASPASAGS